MYNRMKQQGGFSLLIALLVVGVVTGVLTAFIQSQSGEVKRNEARIAGWEGAEIARAARIYSRNEIIARPNLVVDLDPVVGTGPEIITVNDLINDGLLPSNFLRLDGGGNFINALGQPIRIFMANYPVSGDSALETTVPTAYVVFDDTPTTSPSDVQDIVQSIRARDVAVSAPLFNGAVNLTGTCNGGTDTAAVWDSGCLDTTDYIALTGDASFVPGTFVIPAWRSESFDTRALMRFPQPEQIGIQTMLTDLEMANMNDCIADPTQFITTNNDDGTISPTNVCSALSDDATAGAEIDNRRSIVNVTNIDNSGGLIINPQASPDVNIDNMGTIIVDPNEANDINLVNFTGTGDGRVFGNSVNIGGVLGADRTINVVGTSGGVAASADIGTLTGFSSVSNNLTVQNTATFNNNMSVTGLISDVNQFNATNLSSSNVRSTAGTSPTVTINTTLAAGNTLTQTGSDINEIVVTATNTIASTPFSMVAEKLETENVTIPGILDVENSASNPAVGNISFAGNVNSNSIIIGDGNLSTNSGAECFNDCPKREAEALCLSQQAAGIWPVLGYTILQECLDAN